MALGVFDSGVGGLSIHRALAETFPAADLIYLADQAHAPYGSRSGEDIVALTRQGCEHLFARGANLVILACNTASAIALRTLQQSWLPEVRERLGRPVNILGIIVPTIEEATGKLWRDHAEPVSPRPKNVHAIAVFATRATVASRVYEIEVDKHRQDIAAFSEACTHLARLIEDDTPREVLKSVIEDHVANATRRIGRAPDEAILGCTHYEIVADLFAEALPPGTPLIHQPTAVSQALKRYTDRHLEYDIGHSAKRDFFTTGSGGLTGDLVETFWGAPLTLQPLQLTPSI